MRARWSCAGTDLEALADDPDDLAADLQALAGPRRARTAARFSSTDSAAANFRPRNRSAKSASIRILFRRNTTSSARPHRDLHQARHRQVSRNRRLQFGHAAWNSRNPYAAEKAPFLLQEFEGSVSGPGQRASFTLDGAANMVDNGSISNGVHARSAVARDHRSLYSTCSAFRGRLTVSPRIDYQLEREQHPDAALWRDGAADIRMPASAGLT